jgi:hypothetical protein
MSAPELEDEEDDKLNWGEHRMYVTRTLRDIGEQQKENTKEIIAMKIQIAVMAVKGGAISGGVITVLIELIKYLIEKK